MSSSLHYTTGGRNDMVAVVAGVVGGVVGGLLVIIIVIVVVVVVMATILTGHMKSSSKCTYAQGRS